MTLTPPPSTNNAPRGLEGLIVFPPDMPFSCGRICIRVPHLFTIGPAIWHFSNIFEFVTPDPLQMPLGAWGLIVSLMNMYTCIKCYPDRSRGLEAFPDLRIDDPNPHASRVSMGECLAHVHSQINMHMCAKFGPDRSSCLSFFPHLFSV